MRNNLLILSILLIAASCHDRSFEKAPRIPDGDGYTLEQMIVLSRHDIRSPFTLHGSVLDSLTPHREMWHEWSSAPGELTMKGGIAETLMGQYFRLWLEDEGFIPENWQPSRREAYFYANSLQRTVATARYFASGLAPAGSIPVKYLPGKKDRTFLAIISADSETFRTEAARERAAIMSDSIMDSLDKAYPVLESILDYENSDYYKEHGIHFAGDPVSFFDICGEEPRMRGMLRTALVTCDALVMQSYEDEDLCRAAFGHNLGDEGWSRISDIVSLYQDILFGAPIVSLNVSLGTMKEINRELGRRGRKFTFLCGHDSTLLGVLKALGAEPYVLEGALERNTPISGKLVIERRSKDGKQFVRLRLVSPTWQQLRELPALNLQNPPASCELRLKGIETNEDGYYSLKDLQLRLSEAISAGRNAESGMLPDYLR